MKLDRVATGSLSLFSFSTRFLRPPRETPSPGGWGVGVGALEVMAALLVGDLQ